MAFEKHGSRTEFCGMRFDPVDVIEAVDLIHARAPDASFDYVTTPNVDHVVRVATNPDLATLYDESWLSMNDSRILEGLAALARVPLPASPGSTVLERVLDRLGPGDSVSVIGQGEQCMRLLRRRYSALRFLHHDPPMWFLSDQGEICKCIEFVIRNPSRLVVLAVGSPQQEILARRVKETHEAKGTGMCVGSAPAFVAGVLLRAPEWIQGLRAEWIWRLAQDPRRLAKRYLVRNLRIVPIFAHEVMARVRSVSSARDLDPVQKAAHRSHGLGDGTR